jgi:hypothetical protein
VPLVAKHVFFVLGCPTCGRRLHIRVEYLGRKVGCPHCGAKLDAIDPAAGDLRVGDGSRSLMDRVEELLETPADPSLIGARTSHPR